jgi:hypothetical protein
MADVQPESQPEPVAEAAGPVTGEGEFGLCDYCEEAPAATKDGPCTKCQGDLDKQAVELKAKQASMLNLWTADFRERYKAAWLATAGRRNFYEWTAETWAESAEEFGNIDPAIAKEKIAEVPFLFPKVMTQAEFDGAVAIVKGWGTTDETALGFMRALVRVWDMVQNDNTLIRKEGDEESPWTPLVKEIDDAWGEKGGLDYGAFEPIDVAGSDSGDDY